MWNDHPASLRIVVVPPFWRSTWFIFLSGCATLVLGYVVYRRRLAADIEKARILGELQAARSVQLGLLPAADPILDGLEISGACFPAREVGGDFFEYLAGGAGESRLSLALGDVSGKGMNAAMTAVMAIGMLHREREIAASPAAMLRHINTTLHAKTDKRLFVAMLVASFESQPRSMVFANAGQSLPIRLRRGELTSLKGKGERLPLGVRERVEYQDCSVDLQPGDILVFTSDGVTDARREDGTFFDDDGLRRVVLGLPPELPAQEMVQKIVTAVKEVTGGGQLHDDVTVVVAKVLGDP
jgi:serine phosphatase RsbU (regulator of sigma subunit)